MKILLYNIMFIFFQNFDGLDSFSEAYIKSPLIGESQRKRRQQLYTHLMVDMDDINMISYFGQLKLIAGKSKICFYLPTIKIYKYTTFYKECLLKLCLKTTN